MVEPGNTDAAIKILRDQYSELLPRWKGVVLTSVRLIF